GVHRLRWRHIRHRGEQRPDPLAAPREQHAHERRDPLQRYGTITVGQSVLSLPIGAVSFNFLWLLNARWLTVPHGLQRTAARKDRRRFLRARYFAYRGGPA